MATATTDVAQAFLPDDHHTLIVRPTLQRAIAAECATVATTDATVWRAPVVADDPTASWVAEGAEIPASDATLAEVTVAPAKLAGLTVISSELAADSTPQAAQVVGDGLARDCARKMDQAFFGDLAAPAPSGLEGLTGTATVDAGATFDSLDPFEAAVFEAENAGASLSVFAANPADALTLVQLKDADGRQLLNTDPANATRRMIAGRPLLISNSITAGTIWGIPRDRVFLVIRNNVKVDVDASAYFTSDQIGVRATMRVGFGFVHPAAVVKISLTA